MGEEKKPVTIDDYLEGVPRQMREALEKLRETIRKAAPEAVEGIAWGMPVFKLQGNLVGFAAFKEHYSLFPMSTAVMEAFKEELSPYDTTKGSIHFKPGKSLPSRLVTKLVKERVRENKAREAARKRR